MYDYGVPLIDRNSSVTLSLSLYIRVPLMTHVSLAEVAWVRDISLLAFISGISWLFSLLSKRE